MFSWIYSENKRDRIEVRLIQFVATQRSMTCNWYKITIFDAQIFFDLALSSRQYTLVVVTRIGMRGTQISLSDQFQMPLDYSVESIPSVQSSQVLKSLIAEISTVQYWQIWPPDCEQLSAVYHPHVHKITKPFTVEIQHCIVLSTYTSVHRSPLFLTNAPMKNYCMHSTCEMEVPPIVW